MLITPQFRCAWIQKSWNERLWRQFPFFEGSHLLLPWATLCYRNPAKLQSYGHLDPRFDFTHLCINGCQRSVRNTLQTNPFLCLSGKLLLVASYFRNWINLRTCVLPVSRLRFNQHILQGYLHLNCLTILHLAVLPGCSPSCGPNAFCQERDGLSQCVCSLGYKGDGYNCTGLYDTYVALVNVDCIPFFPFFLSILVGNISIIILCVDVDECARSETNECDANSLCTDTEGSYVCRCVKGYKGDGRNCTGTYECWLC